jgi:crotonobetainyl-CoA:carnitine CoA-transferase CaiB-like acyl-CoA transferase
VSARWGAAPAFTRDAEADTPCAVGRPHAIELPAPTLGQHTREVLRGLLGLADAELGALERERVIGAEPALELADAEL